MMTKFNIAGFFSDGEQGFPSSKYFQGLHLPVFYLTALA